MYSIFYIYIYIYIYIYYKNTHICIYNIYPHLYRECACIHTYRDIYVYIYIYIYMTMYVCMYMHSYNLPCSVLVYMSVILHTCTCLSFSTIGAQIKFMNRRAHRLQTRTCPYVGPSNPRPSKDLKIILFIKELPIKRSCSSI